MAKRIKYLCCDRGADCPGEGKCGRCAFPWSEECPGCPECDYWSKRAAAKFGALR